MSVKHCSRKQPVVFLAALMLAAGTIFVPASPASADSPNAKCTVDMSPGFDPASTVVDGTVVTVTEEITVKTAGSGSQACNVAVGGYVNDGNAQLQAVTLAGVARPCADLGQKFCTVGNVGASCTDNASCDLGSGGVCTTVGTTSLVHENPTDGYLEYLFDTTGFGGSMVGFTFQYSGGGNYEGVPQVCNDLTVNEDEECEGALITIDRVSGPGEPTAPGAYAWSYRVRVQACEYLYGVTAQGGTNGWAPLVGRSESALHPSTGPGTAVIRKSNNKTDVILWTIGDMIPGQAETLDVDLSGSIKKGPDCSQLFLSGPWSALFSTDGFAFEKSDYTGRVSVFTNSNGVAGDCN